MRIIFSTFAGRFDRMHLLIDRVKKALQLGYITEFHMWDFCRKQTDRDALDALAPIGYTPAGGRYGNMTHHILDKPVIIKTNGPVYIHFSSNMSIEFTDTGTIFMSRRKYIHPNMKIQYGYIENQSILFTYNDGKLTIKKGDEILIVQVQINDQTKIMLESKTNTFWNFGDPISVYKVSPNKHDLHFSEYYKHYMEFHQSEYQNTLLIKADDDIVYFPLQRMSEFINVCKTQTSAALVSANVINNAYRLHPISFMDKIGVVFNEATQSYEQMYRDGKIAEQVHMAFIENPYDELREEGFHELVNQQISINFIGMRSDIFPYFSHIVNLEAYNDECALSLHIPSIYQLNSCIVVKSFVAAHLSFYTQEHSMNTKKLISLYETFEPEI